MGRNGTVKSAAMTRSAAPIPTGDTRGEQWLAGLRHVEAKRAEWQRAL